MYLVLPCCGHVTSEDKVLGMQPTQALVFEIDVTQLRYRLWEVIPATLSWGTLIGLTVLALIIPFWIAIFVIAFDLYALIRGVYMSIHLLYAYRRLRQERDLNWRDRCEAVSGNLSAYQNVLAEKIAQAQAAGQSGAVRELRRHAQEVAEFTLSQRRIHPWHRVQHAIVLPTYDESLAVLRSSLNSLRHQDFPAERLHVVVGFEERAGERAGTRADKLKEEFGDHFGTFLISWHPADIPGEARVKSANATWAMRQLEEKLVAKGITADDVIVSNFDSDSQASPTYFSHMTYAFITAADRYHASYQPLPLYNNNVWDAPAFSRVIATGSTFWQMIESTRPERLVTFSSHSMTLRALKDVGYWQRDIISEDSRIFWQCLLHYHGQYRTVPVYTTVSMDAALAPSWWQTFKNQYKQKRRWAWGIENFPYLAEGFLQNHRISLRTKFTYLFRTLEGHYSWATAAFIVAGLGWLPVFFGGPEFHTTVLSYSLPFMARTIMSVAMIGLVISTALSVLMLPVRPTDVSRWRYLGVFFQWALVPVIATILSALPALDAETRLWLGRDLEFNVMQKTRKGEEE